MSNELPNIKDLVKNPVVFTHYKDGNLWYLADPAFHRLPFPVPISDIGNTTFLAEDKGMLFMRYMRKQLALLTEAKTVE